MSQKLSRSAKNNQILTDEVKAKVDRLAKRAARMEAMSRFIVHWGFIIVAIALFVFFSVTQPRFLTKSSILITLTSIAPMAIAGLGVTLTLTVTGIDLSVGSVAGLAVSISAWVMVIGNYSASTAVVAALIGGSVIGSINALLIIWAKIPDLLATLATMFAVVGLKLVAVGGRSISSNMTLPDGSIAPGHFRDGFLAIERGSILGIPNPVIILLVIALVAWFILEKTKWGRILYAIGANSEATRLAGVRVKLYRAVAYIVCSMLASVSGVLLVARIGQGDVSAGGSLLLNAIAVSLVSVSVLGAGRPNAWGTVFGAVLLGIMTTGFTMAGLPYYTQNLSKGLVLIVALLFSFSFSRKQTVIVAGEVIPNKK